MSDDTESVLDRIGRHFTRRAIEAICARIRPEKGKATLQVTLLSSSPLVDTPTHGTHRQNTLPD